MYRYALIAACTLCACSVTPTVDIAREDMNPAPVLSSSHLIDDVLDTRVGANLDVLFLIDNSPSMTSKQRALAANIGKFIQVIDSAGANYHIGITTSDVGTQAKPGVPWGGMLGGACESYEGDDGVLQNIPCTSRSNGTPDARNACAQHCPEDKFVPTDGHRYISKNYGIPNVPSVMERDPVTGKMFDAGPIRAFKCMALVGDGGCGVEGQLEGAQRALDGHRSENSGFLRPDSMLAVIYLTDEDDCSVQINRRNENDPNTMDCPAGDQNADFKCYNVDYRCIATDVECDQPMNVQGKKTNCKERKNTRLEAVDKYVKFLGGLRRNPAKLFVGGIWALPASDMPSGNLTVSRNSGGSTTPYLNRAPGADAACTYKSDPSIFGQAQLRLSLFARQFKDVEGNTNSLEASICDIDQYGDALGQMGKRIESQLLTSCLGGLPKRLSNGTPACVVGDVDEGAPHAEPDVRLPVCNSQCCDAWASASPATAKDPKIMSVCMNEVSDCYCAVRSQIPGVCGGAAVAGVWRKNNAPSPPGKVVNFKCAVSN